MKLRKHKISDFVKSVKDEICIILGNNGTGKTRKLTELYNHCEISKNIISDSYPISSKLFAKILSERDILDEFTKKKLSDKDLEHVNILLGKEYMSVSFIPYSIGDIVEEYIGESVDSYKEIFGNLFDKDTLEAKYCYYYYIEVENSEGLSYDILDMGVGECQLLAYYIAFTQRTNTHFFIDEPFNYISVKSAENFVKLVVFSMKLKNNQFTFSTNSLEIVDYFQYYSCLIKYLYSTAVNQVITINEKEYFEMYRSRYSFYTNKSRLIYVEDDLAKCLMQKLLEEFVVENIGGSGELTLLAKSNKMLYEKKLNLSQKYFKQICLVYDGDQKGILAKNLEELDFVLFLPFDDVEKTICSMIKEEKSLNLLCTAMTPLKIDQLKEFVRSNESHDAYDKIKEYLSINDEKMLEYIIQEYKEQLRDLCNEIIELFNE